MRLVSATIAVSSFGLAVLCFTAVGSAQLDTPAAAEQRAAAEARRLVGRALQLLEENQIQDAREHLRRAAEASDDAPTRYLAGLVDAQITGDFVERQSDWRTTKVVDAVCLVPDVASFLAAIQRWGDGPMFPVLIEDGWWAPMFIRAFEPARVVRWSKPDNGGNAGQSDALGDLLKAHERRLDRRPDNAPAPPGLVVIDPEHPHAPAAAALTLGRRQRTLVHEPPDAEQLRDEQAINRLNRKLMRYAQQQGLLSARSWFAITLAGDYPIRVRIDNQPHALDDLIGRDANGVRHAVVGRLHGSPEAAIYRAMASLFLQPRRALLVDDYANRGKPIFQAYQFDEAAAILERQMQVRRLTDDASAASLLRLRREAEPFGMIWVNSSGGARGFGLRGRGGRPDDLQVGYPAAFYMVHSFSAANINSPDTIAGRALHNGAYWFFGSTHEPYLHAFVRPTGLAVKAAAGTPLAFAARHTPGHPMHKPWKLIVVGDPLFTLRDKPAERVDEGLPEAATTFAVDAGDAAAQRFRDAMLLNHAEAAEHAAAALAEGDRLPAGDLRSAIWILGQAGRAETISRHIDPERAAEEPIAAMYLAEAAAERFRAARNAGALDQAYLALEQMLLFSTDRQAITQAVRSLVAEAAKRGKDTIVVKALRRRIQQDPMPGSSRKAVQEALPEPDSQSEGE